MNFTKTLLLLMFAVAVTASKRTIEKLSLRGKTSGEISATFQDGILTLERGAVKERIALEKPVVGIYGLGDSLFLFYPMERGSAVIAVKITTDKAEVGDALGLTGIARVNFVDATTKNRLQLFDVNERLVGTLDITNPLNLKTIAAN